MNQTVFQKADFGFNVREHGGRHIFTYPQEQFSGRELRPLIVGFAAVAFIIVIALRPSNATAGFILWPIITAGLFFMVKLMMNRNREDRQFSIGRDDFEVDGHHYPRRDITSLYWQLGGKGTFENRASNVMLFHNAGSITGATTALVNQGIETSRRKFGEKLYRKNCKLVIRFGNKAVVLAKGLNPDTAEIMMQRVVAICEI